MDWSQCVSDYPSAIRWSVLGGELGKKPDDAGEHGEGHADEHTGYGLEAFRLALVEGRHPGGEALGDDMPRWDISDDDL